MDLVVPLESAHVRIERMGAVQLDHLPDVPQVMKGQLIEQMVEAKAAELFVPPGARAD